MKKLLGLFSALVMLFVCVVMNVTVCAANQTTLSVSQLSGKIKTQGRVYQTSDKLYVDWSASGIEFTANCAGDVYVTFDVETVNQDYQTGGVFFTVVVDGVTRNRDFCRLRYTGEHKFKIASNLPSGEHRFEIYRQSEIGSKVAIKSISLTGTIQTAPKANDLYIEFIGDSITAANGILATSATENSGAPIYVDATKGYAYLAAHEYLKADFSTVAVSGIGASIGWRTDTMQDVYPKLRYPHDDKTAYNFSRKPNLIVLALGTNDINRYQNAGLSLENVKQGFVDMLNLVRKQNPGVPILWIHGMMVDGSSPLIEQVIAEAGGASAKLYELRLPKSNAGGNGHPDEEQHALFAEMLSDYITDLLNLKSPATTPTKTQTTTVSTALSTVATTTISSAAATTMTTSTENVQEEQTLWWIPVVLGAAVLVLIATIVVIVCLVRKK